MNSFRVRQRISDYLRKPRMSQKEALFFLKRIAFLISAGIPLAESLRLLESQTTSAQGRRVIRTITTTVSEGKTLAAGLALFPHIWDSYGTHAIAAGEESGRLVETLAYLAEHIARKSTLRRKILSALLYFAIIGVAATVLTLSLTSYIFPKIIPLLASLGGNLPLPTRIVLGLSTYLHTWGLCTVLVIAMLISVGVFAVKRNIAYQRSLERWMIKIPLVGNMLREYAIATITHSLSALMLSGMTLPRSLRASAGAQRIRIYREALYAMETSVESGLSLAVPFHHYEALFSDICTQLLAAGDSSGMLPEACKTISNFYSDEVDDRIKTLTTLIEPVLMLSVGLVVGFIAVSIIEPIYAITAHIHNT